MRAAMIHHTIDLGPHYCSWLVYHTLLHGSLPLVLKCEFWHKGIIITCEASTTSPLVSPRDTWRSSALTSISAWVCSIVLWGVSYVTQWSSSWTNNVQKWQMTLVSSRIPSSYVLPCLHVTFAIGMLDNTFPLHTKMQNYHLKYPNALC